MSPAVAREFVCVERSRIQFWPMTLAITVSLAAGILIGDKTADRRFEERAASIIDYVSRAREDAERVRESLKRGCFDYVMKKGAM